MVSSEDIQSEREKADEACAKHISTEVFNQALARAIRSYVHNVQYACHQKAKCHVPRKSLSLRIEGCSGAITAPKIESRKRIS